MRWRWLIPILTLSLGVSLCESDCVAQTNIDAKIVLQMCEALSKKDQSQMPAAVEPSDAERFFRRYEARVSARLQGCLSAIEIKRDAYAAMFLVESTRYKSRWRIEHNRNFIESIDIDEIRPITVADDEKWEEVLPSAMATAQIGDEVSVLDNEKANVVEFFYATNRREEEKPAKIVVSALKVANAPSPWVDATGYSGERNAELTYGIAKVRVPDDHRIGQLKVPSEIKFFAVTIWREDFDPKKHFWIRAIQKTDEAQWTKSLSSSPSSAKEKRALIFVHGFNTKFRDAAFRTAQIVWDLRFKGTTVLFSWPSRGEILDYFYDEKSALGSRDAFLHVVDNLRKAGFKRIDVIAHSMGNLVAVDALANSAVSRSPASIVQLIMAAPDIDRDMFVEQIPKVVKEAKGLTLYASKNDRALQLSKRVAGKIPRAGDVTDSGPVILAGLATIDVSVIGSELFGLNHGTFATSRNILNDLKILLEKGTPAPRLNEIHEYPEPPQKATHFRYVP